MVDPVVKREMLRITEGTLILSIVMQLVFFALKCWDTTVIFGNLLGASAAILNFFLMCLTVQRCVALDSDKAALKIRASQTGRLFMLAAFLSMAALLPKSFNIFAAAIPLVFPTITIMVYRFIIAKKNISQMRALCIKPDYNMYDEKGEEQK